MAGSNVAGSDDSRARFLFGAEVDGAVAAGMKSAAGRRVDQACRLAGDARRLSGPGLDGRERVQQSIGVRVPGCVSQFVRRSALGEPVGVMSDPDAVRRAWFHRLSFQ